MKQRRLPGDLPHPVDTHSLSLKCRDIQVHNYTEKNETGKTECNSFAYRLMFLFFTVFIKGGMFVSLRNKLLKENKWFS